MGIVGIKYIRERCICTIIYHCGSQRETRESRQFLALVGAFNGPVIFTSRHRPARYMLGKLQDTRTEWEETPEIVGIPR